MICKFLAERKRWSNSMLVCPVRVPKMALQSGFLHSNMHKTLFMTKLSSCPGKSGSLGNCGILELAYLKIGFRIIFTVEH